MSFVHLHTHTQYSLLDGSNKVENYVKKVKAMGMNACAITDHGVMYGVIDFYKTCEKEGIRPVIGCEVYVAPESRFDREMSKGDDRYYHLILLAENNTGYDNLMHIVSIGFIDGFYYKPRVDFEVLEKYHEGIICLSACLAGEVARTIVRGDYELAKATAIKYRDCFGEGNYYLEMQDHGYADQQTVNSALLRMHEETGIPLVVTNDCHYTEDTDAEAHDVLLCLQTGKKVQDEDRMRYTGGQFYVKSEEEMRALFPYAREALDNTQLIADRCNVKIEFGNTKLPRFDVPEGFDSWTYLNKLCEEGLIRRYGDRADEIRPQLDYELNVIRTMGYVDYFLIVWDFINYARQHDIPVGPGRGSAAGSLVSYTTGITDIDPIKYQLFFERFLNPERVSMPDIDVDFEPEGRNRVIEYVTEKYGEDCVAQIVTFGTMKAKNSIRDACRVMDMPRMLGDRIAKSIPNELNITISDALEKNRDLRSEYDSDPEVKKLIDTALGLEGLPRQIGTHAAGVVISQKPVMEYVPLAVSPKGQVVTQFVMTEIEQLGLLKMDFLGLTNLTVIQQASRMAEKNYGVKIDFNNMEYNDPKVFALISAGRTEGVFQLESAGMTSFMMDLKPESLEDIIAGISLYRPGPMDFIPNYLAGKKDRDSITYLCPQLEPILKPTYGCIVYQEQVMQIVRDLAGFTMGRSDEVRRAMSKKKTSVMEAERQVFVYGDEAAGVPGCIKNGISEAVANQIYDLMIDFAKYAFNKAHAACYAVVGYQTAYLKAYYPKEFMAALMDSAGDSSKIAQYIQCCRKMDIRLLPPDINRGYGRFSVEEEGIRFGMYAIKSVGDAVIDNIVSERQAHGSYTSLEDFLRRTAGREVNKRAVENLIKAGALDSIPGNRRQKVLIFPELLDTIVDEKKHTTAGQMSLFDMIGEEDKKSFEIEMPRVDEYDKQEALAFEKEVMGIYVSGHPLEDYEKLMEENVTARSTDFMIDPEDDNSEAVLGDDEKVVAGGMITSVKTHYTRKNDAMSFVTIEDVYGSIEVIVFPRIFDRCRQYLVEDEKVFIKGRTSVEEEKDVKILAEDIIPFDMVPSEVWIQFEDLEDYRSKEEGLYNRLTESSGRDKVVVFLKNTRQIKRLDKKWNINADGEFLASLRAVYGEGNVKTVAGKV
ncbi:MAG: DNA polymerase III subunit alpha [Lachnospiraceae bacterium]|nr:DNA polymerase III subunit alpha [Lachnospiraceae bacterium]